MPEGSCVKVGLEWRSMPKKNQLPERTMAFIESIVFLPNQVSGADRRRHARQEHIY